MKNDLLKLSSIKIIPAASFATSVPAIPIAKPISAFFKAGASFVPSPVTATTLFNCLSPVTSKYLSSGLERARTRSSFATISKAPMSETLGCSSSLPFTKPPTYYDLNANT